MAFNFTDMLGNLLGGMGKSLGYDMPIAQRKPNGPPTKQLLPSQQAHQEMMHGMGEAMRSDAGGFTNKDDLMNLSFHKYGGRLDPEDINIVGEDGPEAIVGQQVIPLQPNRRMGMIDEQLGTTGGHTPEDYGLAQTEDTPWSAQTPTANTADSIPSTTGMLSPQGSPANPSGEPMPDPNSEEGIQSELQKTLQERTKRSPWADLGVSLVQAGDNWFNHKNEPIKTWAELKTDRKLTNLGQRLGVAKEARTAKEQADYAKARTANIYADNEYQRDVLADRAAGRDQTEADKAISSISKLKYFDPKNPIHAALAKAGKLDPTTLQGWDDRNPYLKQVAGTTYKYNQKSQSFEPTNLPVDEKQTTTDYKVKMPTGEVRSFKVSQRDAANFATQMNALGARLEQSDRQFTEKMKFDKERATALDGYRQAGLGLRAQELEFRKNGQTKQADDAARKLASMKVMLATRVREGKITQDEADDILNEMNGVSAEVGMGEPTP